MLVYGSTGTALFGGAEDGSGVVYRFMQEQEEKERQDRERGARVAEMERREKMAKAKVQLRVRGGWGGMRMVPEKWRWVPGAGSGPLRSGKKPFGRGGAQGKNKFVYLKSCSGLAPVFACTVVCRAACLCCCVIRRVPLWS